MRDCVIKLPEEHVLKTWFRSISRINSLKPWEQEKKLFLTEVLNLQFNLVVDPVLKNKIMELISDVPQNTLGERLLKSYLYLISGNVAKSDRLLREFIFRPPYENWLGFSFKTTIYHKAAIENLDQILLKLSKHPSERTTYKLFLNYLVSFYNDTFLVGKIDKLEHEVTKDEINLRYTEKIAPELVNYLRFKQESETVRLSKIRDTQRLSISEQAFWYWVFINVEVPKSDNLISELKKIEIDNPLWFFYLMDNEKLSDMYFKKEDRSLLSGRRKFLREQLNDEGKFMVSLFKLIEIGDIDQELVQKTSDFFSHE